MRTINVYSKKDIEQIVEKRLEKALHYIHNALDILRVKVNDLESNMKKW